MNEQRLIEIETKLAYQEVLIGELNQVISLQQATIDRIESSLKSFLKGYLDAGKDEAGPANEKPPHY